MRTAPIKIATLDEDGDLLLVPDFGKRSWKTWEVGNSSARRRFLIPLVVDFLVVADSNAPLQRCALPPLVCRAGCP